MGLIENGGIPAQASQNLDQLRQAVEDLKKPVTLVAPSGAKTTSELLANVPLPEVAVTYPAQSPEIAATT